MAALWPSPTCGMAAAAASGPGPGEKSQHTERAATLATGLRGLFPVLSLLGRLVGPVAPVAGVGLLPCFIVKRGASAADALAVPPRGRPVSAKAAFQRVPAARSARQVRRQHPESRGGITPTALAGGVLWFSLGLPPSSICALRIEGNDRPETRCRTEGIDSRPVFLPEFLQPARLAPSFSATSIRQSRRGTDEQSDQSRLVTDQERFSPPGAPDVAEDQRRRGGPVKDRWGATGDSDASQ